DGVPPLAHGVEGRALVRIGTLHAAAAEHAVEARVEVLREIRVTRLLRGEAAQRRQHRLFAQRPLDLQRLEDGEQRALRVLAPQDELLAHAVPPTDPWRPSAQRHRLWSDGQARNGQAGSSGSGSNERTEPETGTGTGTGCARGLRLRGRRPSSRAPSAPRRTAPRARARGGAGPR